MARNNRGGRNNNPTGRNQYSDWGVMEMARDRPMAAAAVAAGAAAAGLFLWSKRAQISDQLSSLSDQFSEWREGISTDDFGDDTSGLTTSSPTNRQRGMSETGSGNASLDARSGGGGSSGSASGRGRAKSTAATQQ
jgi:hypothetical protein